ncbi:MAG: 3-hydroxyacyl-ACP dehydratase FabZ [Firmicutes bacterium]|nr:3-hydroxyacyl-ACP dehydratase FabZ [Bacillota bacterium]
MTLNSNEIEKLLPHRFPMLLVDRIVDMEPGVWAVGRKCVSANEMFFCGHFPGQHIMPGVLILEALAQVGAAAILSMPEDAGKLVVFGGVKNARFKGQVVPGDVLELSCKLTQRRGAIGFGMAEAKVDGKVVASGELSFAITPAEKP